MCETGGAAKFAQTAARAIVDFVQRASGRVQTPERTSGEAGDQGPAGQSVGHGEPEQFAAGAAVAEELREIGRIRLRRQLATVGPNLQAKLPADLGTVVVVLPGAFAVE